MSYCIIIIMHILFSCTSQKNVLHKEINDWAFEVYLATGEPNQFLIPADWITKNDLSDPMHGYWIYYVQTQ